MWLNLWNVFFILQIIFSSDRFPVTRAGSGRGRCWWWCHDWWFPWRRRWGGVWWWQKSCSSRMTCLFIPGRNIQSIHARLYPCLEFVQLLEIVLRNLKKRYISDLTINVPMNNLIFSRLLLARSVYAKHWFASFLKHLLLSQILLEVLVKDIKAFIQICLVDLFFSMIIFHRF